jgi:phage-related protein
MKTKRLISVVMATLGLCTGSRAYNTVHDPIHTVLNVAQQVYGQVRQELQHTEDVSKYTAMIQKQVEQINQLTNIINQDIEQLRRFGNPNTYVNMLGLDDLLNEVNKMKTGVGRTVEEFRQTADGIAALKNTGKGLYDDFSEMSDKFGQEVRYTSENFKKFGVVQDMYEDFNNQLNSANESVGRLENEVTNTANQINGAASLVETEKLKAKLQAVQGVVDTSMQRATLAAWKILVQGESNRNDQARAQEAVRQRKAQEMQTENQELYLLGGKLLGPSETP